MTAILNAKKSRQDRETLPISSSIEHDARYFLNDDFKKRQETTNFPLLQDISASLFWKQQVLNYSGAVDNYYFLTKLLFHFIALLELPLIENNRNLYYHFFSWETAKPRTAVHFCSFTLSGFRILTKRLLYVRLPCCFSSSLRSSLTGYTRCTGYPLKNMKNSFIHSFEFENLTGTSQARVETYLLPLKRVYNF